MTNRTEKKPLDHDAQRAAERAETTRGATIRAESFDEADNSVEVEFASGARVMKYDWRNDVVYMEDLPVDRMDLSEIDTGGHVLKDHSRDGLDDVIGSVVPGTARLEGGNAVARVRLSQEPDDATIVNKIRGKIIRKWSFGYDKIGRYEETRDEATGLPVRTWPSYLVTEISPVPVPADGMTDTRARQEPAPKEEPMTTQTAPEPTPEVVVDEAAIRAAATEEGVREGMKIEAGRRDAINDAAGKLGIDKADEAVRALLDDSKINEADARAKLIDLRADRAANADNATSPEQTGKVEAGADEGDKIRAAMGSALVHRSDNSQPLPAEARDFRHLSMMGLAGECVRRAGGNPMGLGPDDLLRAALNMPQSATRMHSTSDFPLILADAMHKNLINGYSEEVRTFLPLSEQRTLSDFRDSHELQVGSFSDLSEIKEGGEITYGTLSEGEQTWALLSYAKGLRLTRKAIVNDNMGIFSTLRNRIGATVARKENDLFFGKITGNLMADGATSIFSAAHLNATTTGGAAPSITQIGYGRTLLRKMTDLDSQILNLHPSLILVPAALEDDIDQLVRDKIVAVDTDKVVPQYIRTLTPIVEPRLDATSEKFWYLFVSPAAWTSFVHGYLAGSEQPRFSSRESWEVQGVEMKIEHDYGCANVDYRGVYRNKGE